MESSVTPVPISPQRADVLAEVAYTHREEDFVAMWMYYWEETQNQRFHPHAHRLGSWMSLTLLRALAIAFVGVVASALTGERATNYILGGTAVVICLALVMGLTAWSLRGPKGLLHTLARWRYRRKMRWTARQMAARKMDINLGRFHRLLLTPDSCIHRVELHEIEPGSKLTERTEIITSWAAFECIEGTDQHAFLIERRKWTTILPRRAFADEAVFRQFVDLACHLHRTAILSNAPSAEWKQSEERIVG